VGEAFGEGGFLKGGEKMKPKFGGVIAFLIAVAIIAGPASANEEYVASADYKVTPHTWPLIRMDHFPNRMTCSSCLKAA